MKSPKPPDATKTAAAQGAANREASVASSIVNNPNEVNPYGTLNYEQTGTEYVTDATGKQVAVPRYTKTTTLSPEQQQLYGQQTQLGSGLNELAISQVDRLGDVLGQPVSTEGLQDYTNVGGNDFDASRTKVEEALLSRLNEQYGQDRSALEAQLAGQGVVRNSEAWNKGLGELNERMEDARIAAILGGGQEQSRMAGLEQSEAGFNNNLRAQQLSELFGIRNQPINEVSALMSGGQVTVPQFQGSYRQGIGAEPIADSIYANYNAKANQAGAFNQGLFGLLGSGIGAAPLLF